MKRFALLLLLFLSFLPSALATSRLEGPVPVQLIRVIDGDTVLVEVRPWFGHRFEVSVRLYGIDAPELNGRCDSEKNKAQQAKSMLEQLLEGQEIVLRHVQKGKYFGRVIAKLEVGSGVDLSQYLLKSGLVRVYLKKRRGWCHDL